MYPMQQIIKQPKDAKATIQSFSLCLERMMQGGTKTLSPHATLSISYYTPASICRFYYKVINHVNN